MSQITRILRTAQSILDSAAPGTESYLLAWHVTSAYRANAQLMDALEQSVEMQSHYAALLNEIDGGVRFTFRSADEWIVRLREIRESSTVEFPKKKIAS